MTMLTSLSSHPKAFKIFFAALFILWGSIATRFCRLLKKISIIPLLPVAFFGRWQRVFHPMMVDAGQNRVETFGNLMQVLKAQFTFIQLTIRKNIVDNPLHQAL